MKFCIIFVIILSCVKLGILQQCRQVCEYDVPVGGGSQRGDVGAPGKAGPEGVKGQKGEVGIGMKGMQGESCALGSFEDEIRQRLSSLERRLLPTSSSSCLTSSVYGRQMLRSGEEAFCDGGWTVMQKRFDGSVDFQLSWEFYKNGFGNLSGEFWLGLDKIHQMTVDRGCKLRVDLWSFDDDHAFAEYRSFSIEDESDNYRLHIDGYRGTAGDSLGTTRHNNVRFSTPDRDNDNHGSNCARTYQAGWWFGGCHYASLNAPWGESTGDALNIVWYHWKGHSEALKKSTMKFRCD